MTPWKRLRLNVPLIVGFLLLGALFYVLILPSVADLPDPLARKAIIEVGRKYAFPPFRPGEHGFRWGSDGNGRDMLANVIYAARPTMAFTLLITLMRALLSIPLGLWAGWRRGWVARTVDGLATGLGSLPALLLVLYALATVQAVLPDGVSGWVWPAVVMVATGVPRLAEQVRRLTEEAAVRPHIEAAIAAGAAERRILWRHIFPLLRGDLLVAMTAEIGWVLLMIGQLAVFNLVFVGPVVRAPGDTAAIVEMWGTMMAGARDLLRTHPWVPYEPAVALGLATMGFHLFAEGIRQRWVRR